MKYSQRRQSNFVVMSTLKLVETVMLHLVGIVNLSKVKASDKWHWIPCVICKVLSPIMVIKFNKLLDSLALKFSKILPN